MSIKTIAISVLIGFVILLLGAIIYFEPSFFQNTEGNTVQDNEKIEPTQKPKSPLSVDRLQEIEDSLDALKEKQRDQDSLIVDLSEKINDLSTASAALAHKTILDTKQTQGSTFTTSSTAYTSMGMFVNISCSQKCVLWTNFYSSSKNDSSNNVNTYGIFINGQDEGIYSQGNVGNADAAIPIALNASLPFNAGSYTVEIKAKTSGGTLKSDVSFLQVMAIEQ